MAAGIALGVLLPTACSGDDDAGTAASTTALVPLVTPVAAATTAVATVPGTTLPPATTSSTSTTTTTTLPPTTTTTFPFVNQGAAVIVANAAGLPGAATEISDQLAAYGFTMLPPTNGAGPEEEIDITRIYARPEPEVQAVALSVARVMGELPVERMPTPAPIDGATDGLGGATILVMLGKDLAGKELPGPPGV